MDNLLVRLMAQCLLDLLGSESLDPLDFAAGVVRQAAAKFLAAPVAERDDITLVERTGRLANSDGQ